MRVILGLGDLAVLDTVGTSQIGDESVTLAKIEDLTQTCLLGRAYAAGTGIATKLNGSNVTKIGTGGYSGINAATKVFARCNAAGSVDARHTLTFVNGWLTAATWDGGLTG
jgi:hypothetical protein